MGFNPTIVASLKFLHCANFDKNCRGQFTAGIAVIFIPFVKLL